MIERKKISRFANKKLSRIGFGGAAISGEGGGYGFGAINEQSAIELLKRSFDAGINVFDTAPVYGFTLSERRIGKAFKNLRDSVFIISKCGVTYDQNKRIRISNDPKIAKEMLDQSLKDLQSDYIDLYMIHWPDDYFDIRSTLEVLVRAQESGKIKYIGLANTNIVDLERAEEIVGKRGVDAVQSELNIFNRVVVDEIFLYLREKEIPFFAWGTLDKGIISGRVNRDRYESYDSYDARSWAPWWKNPKAKELREKKILAMEEIRSEMSGLSGLSLGVNHNLSYLEVTSTLCGVRNLEQLEQLSSLQNVDVGDIDKALRIVKKYGF
ncbi:MAG: aldo/keto reductase [Oligoflexia bacterium]|nr:aldo/keto reductase [Oligoflexia bacterium]